MLSSTFVSYTYSKIYFQGGQYILEIVDYYGGTFMRLFAAIIETIGIFWIYGKQCRNKTNLYLQIESYCVLYLFYCMSLMHYFIDFRIRKPLLGYRIHVGGQAKLLLADLLVYNHSGYNDCSIHVRNDCN